MVQHKDCDGSRKGALCERKRRSVALHDSVSIFSHEASGKRVTPFEARDARDKSLQGFGASARACAQLKHMVTQ